MSKAKRTRLMESTEIDQPEITLEQLEITRLERGRKSAKKSKSLSTEPPPKATGWLVVRGAEHNNLKGIDVGFPLGRFIAVTGVSGSGKSSLVNDILRDSLLRSLNGAETVPGKHRAIEGYEQLTNIIAIDQSPIGRTPRSNPATYIKVFDRIRDLYANLPEAKVRGYQPGRFSFNVEGGRCEACEGNGSKKLDMDFLADVWVTCPVCQGRRFNRETLQIRFKERTIHDCLEMEIGDARAHFDSVPGIAAMLQTLIDVGVDYLKLGQPSPTLSGGEAQRIKLARELCKRSTGKTLYVLDEPTTGLHFADVKKLLTVLHGFVDAGNTVVVIEHNLDVIKTADWIIDLGPEGGSGGGRLLAEGTPEEVMQVAGSHTGQSLKLQFAHQANLATQLSNGSNGKKLASKKAVANQLVKAKSSKTNGSTPTRYLSVEGARQHNLKEVNARIPLHQTTVCSGPSGSGKTSFAIETLYAEGQRRYVESLSSYARQFLGQMQKPNVERVDSLSPAICIEQKAASKSPRSTVGTVTEIYDFFRILFARLGKPYCPKCQLAIGTQTTEEIIDKLLQLPDGQRIIVLAPIPRDIHQDFDDLWKDLTQRGFMRIRVDGEMGELSAPPTLSRRRKHEVEVVVDRLIIRPNVRSRLADSIEAALDLGHGQIKVLHQQGDALTGKEHVDTFSLHLTCDKCGRGFSELTPNHYSFNTPLGWCPACEGLGTQIGGGGGGLTNSVSPDRSILEGGLHAIPECLDPENPLNLALRAVAKHIGFDINEPFGKLSSKSVHALFQGTGDAWLELGDGLGTQFQFKGVFPAIAEASRVSWVYRHRLMNTVGTNTCSECDGSRLRDDAAAVRFHNRTLLEWCSLPLEQTLRDVEQLKLSSSDKKVAGDVLREIINRLQFLVDVGLHYLTLGRGAATLSGGESQRIKLASQLGSGLTGVLYVLDEPTIGLHPRDNGRLLSALHKLRGLGNTLVMVEHDREVIADADYLLDFGPGSGRKGGTIVAAGTPTEIAKNRDSLTGQYLSGSMAIAVPDSRRPGNGLELTIVGARQNNLRGIDVTFPLGRLIAVTGVSGSGKSSLISDILWGSLARRLHRAQVDVGLHEQIVGIEHLDKVINVDQQPIGNSPASNAATYVGVFDLVRELFAQLPDSKIRGYHAGRFSFNRTGGRCEACEGNGQRKIEMHFLPDVWVTCEECQGKRYTHEMLAIKYKGQTIADVLEMSVDDAFRLFENIPKIRRLLETMVDVGLGYLPLGQSATTLSGGESQRIKLAAELARPSTGKTMYLLDEPTTGLHFDDIRKLLAVLHRLVDRGNTVIVIEHNLDVIKTVDWIIDIGPEGGSNGGSVVFAGTPEDLVATTAGKKTKSGSKSVTSHTAIALAPVMAAGPIRDRGTLTNLDEGTASDNTKESDAPARKKASKGANAKASRTGVASVESALTLEEPLIVTPAEEELEIWEVGSAAKMPWEVDGAKWHTSDRISRTGKPCRWDGAALKFLIDELEKHNCFAETNWNDRSLVEITATKKSAGWFLHAHTNDEWLLWLKFRPAKGTFKTELLDRQLKLKPLDQMPEIPRYGNQPRVRVSMTRTAFQQIDLSVYRKEEIDTPAFREFLAKAIASFEKVVGRGDAGSASDADEPWKKDGKAWHVSERGFRVGKQTKWDRSIVSKVLACIENASEGFDWDWDNRDSAKRRKKGVGQAWARLMTKLPRALELHLVGKKGSFNLAAIDHLGADRELRNHVDRFDSICIRFLSADDIQPNSLEAFLEKHLQSFLEYAKSKSADSDEE